ncbi:hypothetical protein [Microbacterium sp. NPDC089695]|uniref:hypothetical protein n=1 Tax=Microbacterium sp. NPDC089695 TaxID=3364198 RepID=UPI0037F686C7
MTSRQLRLVRAAAASAVATVLAAVSHTVVGGAVPHPLLVVAMTALLVPLSALLIGARTSRTRVALVVLVSQSAFHGVFALLGAPAAGATVIGHQHHLDLSVFGPAVAVAAPDAAMLAAHVVAALVTTALLCHGESMIRAIARWIVARLRLRVASVRLPHRHRLLLDSQTTPRIESGLSASLSRRGPPAPV